ncbi:hypothetical protein [Microbispora oryzae]|uniref:hypothetical protein n=1 Tax=Microbispora oryzae TaxID=2806554 RepID=UPI001AEBE925|nr:hypothetical protein [Microbispora oryzae]
MAAVLLPPLAMVSALIVGARPAAAVDGEIVSPAAGEVVRAAGPVNISARTDWYQVSMALYVEGPSVGRQKIGSGGADQTLSGSFDPGNAPNGTFTVSLYGEITHKTYATSTFVLSRPPEAPSGVEAQLKDPSRIVVTWARGPEPDLRAYDVSSTKLAKAGSVPVDTACSGGLCQASLTVPKSAAGQKVDVAVRAIRSDGQGGEVGSARSAAYVGVPAAKASPKPSPAATAKSGTEATKPRTAHTNTRGGIPTHVAPVVPTLSADPGEGLRLPQVSQAGQEPVPARSAVGLDAQASSGLLGGLNPWVYVAIAVVLLLVGAHLGALMVRRRAAPVPASPVAGDGGRSGAGVDPATGSPALAPARSSATTVNGAGFITRRPTVILATSTAGPSPAEPSAAGPTTTAASPAEPSTTESSTTGASTTGASTTGASTTESSTAAEASTAVTSAGATTDPAGPATTASSPTTAPASAAGTAAPDTVAAPATPEPEDLRGDNVRRLPLRQPEPDVWMEEDEALPGARVDR